MRTLITSLGLVMALGGSVAAQEMGTMESPSGSRAGGVGIGAEAMLTGPAGATFVYDASAWYLAAILALADIGDDTDIALGGRFFYVVHSATAADLAVGGGLGFINSDGGGMGDDETDIHIEGGAQIRAFVVPNVAFNAFLGLSILIDDGDDDGVLLSGQRVGAAGGAGITYFFD